MLIGCRRKEATKNEFFIQSGNVKTLTVVMDNNVSFFENSMAVLDELVFAALLDGVKGNLFLTKPLMRDTQYVSTVNETGKGDVLFK